MLKRAFPVILSGLLIGLGLATGFKIVDKATPIVDEAADKAKDKLNPIWEKKVLDPVGQVIANAETAGGKLGSAIKEKRLIKTAKNKLSATFTSIKGKLHKEEEKKEDFAVA